VTTKIRRYRVDLTAVLLIFVVAIAVYAPVLVPGRTLLPTDLLLITPPWAQASQTLDPDFTHVLRRTWDPLFQFYPSRKFLAESLRQGWIPLWNPHVFSGTPFAADGQSAIFYPINWLFAVLPLGFAFGAVAFLHSFLTGAFFYGYGRRMGYSWPGSLAGAVIWMLCGVQVGWQMWQVVDSTLCWLPLCLFFWEGLRGSNDTRQGLGLSFSIAMTLLAGHLQFAFYVISVVVTYALYRPIVTPFKRFLALRSFSLFCTILLLGIALSAVQPLATADLLRLTIRQATPLHQVLPSALPPAQLGLLIMPEILGGERDYLHHTFLAGDYYEKVVYCGAAGLVFALFGLRLKKAGDLSRYWLGIMVFSLLMGCGTPLYDVFYFGVPLFKSFHGLTRIFVLFDFAVAALAAQGITLIGKEAVADRKQTSKIVAGSAFVLLLVGYRMAILSNGNTVAFMLTHDWLQYGLVQAETAAVFITAAILIVATAPTKVAWIAVPLVVIDMTLFAIGLNPGGKTSLLYPATPETQYVSNQLALSPLDRVLCLSDGRADHPQSRITPNGAMSLGWNDVSGSDPLILTRYNDFIHMVNMAQSGVPEPGGQGMIASCGSKALDYVDARWIVTGQVQQIPNYRLAYSGAVNVYENGGVRPNGAAWLAPSWTNKYEVPMSDAAQDQMLLLHSPPIVDIVSNADWPLPAYTPFTAPTSGKPRISRPGPGRLLIDTSSDGINLLVVSQTSCPGWMATCDGKVEPVAVVNDLLTGVIVPPGVHQISLIYEPIAVRLGLFFVCFGWLVLSLAAARSLIDRRFSKIRL
jgi:hypothetical protein